jgi:hypothetical protein
MRVWLADRGLLSALDRFAKLGTPDAADAADAAAAAASHSLPLCVVGDSGVGASALLANWAERYRADHPEHLVVTHFVGCTGDSTSVPLMLRRLLHEVECVLPSRADNAAVVVPSDDSEFQQSLPRLLERVLRTNNAHAPRARARRRRQSRRERVGQGAVARLARAPVAADDPRAALGARRPASRIAEMQRRQYPVVQRRSRSTRSAASS